MHAVVPARHVHVFTDLAFRRVVSQQPRQCNVRLLSVTRETNHAFMFDFNLAAAGFVLMITLACAGSLLWSRET